MASPAAKAALERRLRGASARVTPRDDDDDTINNDAPATPRPPPFSPDEVPTQGKEIPRGDATPRDEDVVDVSSGDAELARMMARFEGQDGLDYSRVAPTAPSRPARPPPPVYEDAWREPEPVVFADDDDDFSLGGGGAAPWDVIQ